MSLTTAVLAITNEDSISETESEFLFDPLIQDVEGHDHRNGSQHNLSTPNFEALSFNQLTEPGNAKFKLRIVQTAVGTLTSLDGRRCILLMSLISNTTVTGVYLDPNTQVLDVKYLEYNAREYVIVQNQLVDSGNADPNVGEWGDPAQVTVTLIDVTDKSDPQWVDSYDFDHPSGPHNLYTHMIDGEWYIFVANLTTINVTLVKEMLAEE